MVVFRQFNGVAPTSYIKLFRPKGDRKQKGHLVRIDRKDAIPVFRVPLDARREYEDKIIVEVAAKESVQLTQSGDPQ
jgi:hypothetical protein